MARGNEPEIIQALEPLWRLGFHKQRNQQLAWWDRLYVILLKLLPSPNKQIAESARHYLFVCLDSEYGPPWTDREKELVRRRDNFARRITQSLPAARLHVSGKDESFLRFLDQLVDAEGLCDCAGLPSVRDWISTLESEGRISAEAAETAGIIYDCSRLPWEEALPRLRPLLDHPSYRLRAYAGRVLGNFYLRSDELDPPLKQMVGTITEKEILRPGIAGPFFSPFSCEMEAFENRMGLRIEEWFMELLEKRNGPEPNVLPCSNNIDFYAHEVLSGQPKYIERLISMGNCGLAVEAATEIDRPVEGLQPLLVELGNNDDPEIVRLASWHLAYHYRFLHPRGETFGLVRAFQDLPDIDLFLNFDQDRPRFPYSAVIYPKVGAVLSEQAAWRWVNKILPGKVRGKLVPYEGAVQGRPLRYVWEREVSLTFRNGALLSFEGDVKRKRWEQATIIWHGPKETWEPASYLRE